MSARVDIETSAFSIQRFIYVYFILDFGGTFILCSSQRQRYHMLQEGVQNNNIFKIFGIH